MQVIPKVAIVLLVVGCAAAAQPPPLTVATGNHGQLPEMVASVGYRDWEGLPEFSVFANGSTIINATLDPALTSTVIKPSAAKSLKITELPTPVAFTFLGSSYTAPHSVTVNLAFSNSNAVPVSAGLLNLMASLSPERAHRPDAPAVWLGYSFLKQFQVRVNPGSHIIEFLPGSLKLKLDHGALVVKFVANTPVPTVKVAVPGSPPFNAVISLTSPVTVLPATVIARLAGDVPVKIPVRLPNGTVTHVEGVKVAWLAVDRAKVNDMQVLGADAASAGVAGPTALLGMDFLQHFKFTMDFVGGRLVLEPLAPPAMPLAVKPVSPNAHDGFNPR